MFAKAPMATCIISQICFDAGVIAALDRRGPPPRHRAADLDRPARQRRLHEARADLDEDRPRRVGALPAPPLELDVAPGHAPVQARPAAARARADARGPGWRTSPASTSTRSTRSRGPSAGGARRSRGSGRSHDDPSRRRLRRRLSGRGRRCARRARRRRASRGRTPRAARAARGPGASVEERAQQRLVAARSSSERRLDGADAQVHPPRTSPGVRSAGALVADRVEAAAAGGSRAASGGEHLGGGAVVSIAPSMKRSCCARRSPARDRRPKRMNDCTFVLGVA